MTGIDRRQFLRAAGVVTAGSLLHESLALGQHAPEPDFQAALDTSRTAFQWATPQLVSETDGNFGY
jgi:hypothetical protein